MVLILKINFIQLINMFEDGESNSFSLVSLCSFCNKKIKFMPLSSLDKSLKFCDIICAKLYYDNVDKFEINRIEYNNYYNNDQLSKRARDIYNKVGNVMFKLLPIYKPNETDEEYGNKELMKRKYFKMLSPVLFK